MVLVNDNRRLYPYQDEDVDELIGRPRIILGSVMRAGNKEVL